MSSTIEIHKTTVTSLSMTMVAVMAVAIVMLFRNMEVDYSPREIRDKVPVVVDIQVFRERSEPVQDERLAEIELRFQQAVVMLHAGQYEHAATALHRVLELSPRLTDAHVNMGYALLGMGRNKEAESFFRTATDLDPYKANAYWGLAVALENQNDLQGALGAMRTFIHLSPKDSPFVRRARSALWEWDNRLARGPLPEAEAQWLKEGGEKWEQRNSPDRDMPEQDDLSINVRPAQ